jgi:transposase
MKIKLCSPLGAGQRNFVCPLLSQRGTGSRLGAQIQCAGAGRSHRPQGRGQPPRLNEAHRAALAAILESGPIPAVHGVVRWRIVDLCQWIFEEFRVVVAEQTLSRVLRAMGYRKLSARPRHHAQPEGAIEDFKKVSRPAWKRSGARRASIPAQ